jgi:hypothetical protein
VLCRPKPNFYDLEAWFSTLDVFAWRHIGRKWVTRCRIHRPLELLATPDIGGLVEVCLWMRARGFRRVFA